MQVVPCSSDGRAEKKTVDSGKVVKTSHYVFAGALVGFIWMTGVVLGYAVGAFWGL
jgi:uncharacterized membrane protein